METLRDFKNNNQELPYSIRVCLVELLTKRCKNTTIIKLNRILKEKFIELPNSWYWDRFHYKDDGITTRVSYCAGQDYVYEIASIRRDILQLGESL